MNEKAAALAREVRELFPELAGQPVDVDVHAPSVIMRALNDGSAALQDRVIGYYGEDVVRRVAVGRADRLTNPAYRFWRDRLGLPERDQEVEFVQSFWRS